MSGQTPAEKGEGRATPLAPRKSLFTPAATTRAELIASLRAGTPWMGDLNAAADLLEQDAARPLPAGDTGEGWTVEQEREACAALFEAVVELIKSERLSASLQVAEALERAAAIAEKYTNRQALRLAAGEMTAQEARTATAVAKAIALNILGLIPTLPKGDG